jgi:3-oxoacyl-[acyl-carrier protein] reductase
VGRLVNREHHLRMSNRFLGQRNAIVTGATRGIGLAIARALADAGASVAICGRNQSDVDRVARELSQETNSKVVGKAADVSDSSQVSGFFHFVDNALGGLDILVNNAGIGTFRSTAELSIDDWSRVIDTNLSGVFYCCHEALPRMKKRAGGYIINISSLAGKNPFAGGAAYNASKFGLNGFSEAMMLDHRYDDIRVSYIMPGSVDTEFGSSATGAGWKIAAEDIAEIVMMLLQMPERTLVSRIEVRPSKPKK